MENIFVTYHKGKSKP